MTKPVTFLNTLLCEHVVPGLGNKNTLINVLAGDVVVSEFPARLLFGFYTEYISHVPSGKVRIEINMDRKLFAHVDAEFKDTKVGTPGAIAVPVMEFGIDRDIELTFVAKIDGARAQTILKRRVYAKTTSTD